MARTAPRARLRPGERDLKPANVLLAVDGPRVIDFGLSRATEGSPLTVSGAVLGTPGFMSP
jgi:eukaryotic-like serine/threonine-protein kinase